MISRINQNPYGYEKIFFLIKTNNFHSNTYCLFSELFKVLLNSNFHPCNLHIFRSLDAYYNCYFPF